MIAHVAGMPVEELLIPLLLGAGALTTGVGALLAHRWRSLTRPRAHERSTP